MYITQIKKMFSFILLVLDWNGIISKLLWSVLAIVHVIFKKEHTNWAAFPWVEKAETVQAKCLFSWFNHKCVVEVQWQGERDKIQKQKKKREAWMLISNQINTPVHDAEIRSIIYFYNILKQATGRLFTPQVSRQQGKLKKMIYCTSHIYNLVIAIIWGVK